MALQSFVLSAVTLLLVVTAAQDQWKDPVVFHIDLEPAQSKDSDAKAEVADKDWWKDAVVYQIYPKSFKDSDNDGYGDLKGIISKLDHLKDAGVTVCWLSPIYASPQVDDGYDISDYRNIDPMFGTLDDFDELIARATELGIRVIMDFVPNHTSDQHEWFALSENRTEGYEDYYVWVDGNATGGPPNNWISVFKYSAWQWSETRGQHYLHQFARQQPDLNYNSPAVVQEIKDILKFWLDRGVAGFRVDAIPNLFETGLEDEPRSSDASAQSYEYNYLEHIYTKDQPETFQMVYQWRTLLDDYSNEKGDYSRILMTESVTSLDKVMLYYGNIDTNEVGAHFSFNFQLLGTFASASSVVNNIKSWFDYMPSKYTANWLIGNHDNSRAATRFGPENVDGYNLLIALLPGVLITYNGEEIGQENGEVSYEECQDPSACGEGEEYFYANSRDFARTPYHWDNSTNAGFNDGAKPWLPVSTKYLDTNLAAQSVVGESSHFHVYQEAVELRKKEAILNGNYDIEAVTNNVVVLTRTLSDGNGYVLILNINGETATINVTDTFPNLATSGKVVISSASSPKSVGELIDFGSVIVGAHESFVAEIIPDLSVEELDTEWWKTAVVYQIYPKSFKDSNNDGYGDLQGIISKLEYLKEAGVTVVWLSPIHKSPQVDDGYDISDFKDIDPIFGTLDDFDQLVAKADELEIKIVMDLVPNHSSDQHPWFSLSENRTEGYEDYYVWADANETTGQEPNNWISVFKYSAWKWSETRRQYYLHQFTAEQPDLNYRSQAVVKEMDDVFTFWLDRGVAGFRIDAIPHLFETGLEDEPRSSDESAQSYEYSYLDHVYTKDQPETFEMVYHWRELVDSYSAAKGSYARILMTEAASSISNVVKYYGDEETGTLGAHFSFNFNLLGTFTSARDLVNSIDYWVSYLPLNYTSNWLIGNHDNSRAATRFGPENVDGYNALIALLPGVLVTYNGEEIGQENGEVSYDQCKDPSACDLGEDYFLAHSRDFARTPFQWDNSTNGGFNEGATPWLPVSSKYLQKNLFYQSADGVKSHYHNYQELLQLRQEPAIVSGKLKYAAFSDNVLGLTRTSSDRFSYAFVFNINDEAEIVNLTAGFPSISANLEVVIASVNSTRTVGDTVPADSLVIDAHESLVLLQIDSNNDTSSTSTTAVSSSSSASSSSTSASSTSSVTTTTTSTTTTTTTTTAPTTSSEQPSTEASTGGGSVLIAPMVLILSLIILDVLFRSY